MNDPHRDLAIRWKDELERKDAEIERLRAALSDARDALHNDFEPDNQSNAYKRATRALEASTGEQALGKTK